MIIDKNGRKWYKGNLHMHSTDSDGVLDPDAAAALYREKGYDFIALTDHWVFRKTKTEKDFLMLSGCEYDVGYNVRRGIFHIVGIGMKERPALERSADLTAQQVIHRINETGGIAILAHPAWSLNRVSDILALEGLCATEIYNTVSGVPWNARPYSGQTVDMLAAEGRFMPCMASDDAHFYDGEETKSYLLVQADALTPEAILTAMRAGEFLATQGPVFSYEIAGGVLKVSCTPVHDVIFYSDSVYAPDRVTRGEHVCEAAYHIRTQDTFVRIELVDAQGLTAWSSPIPV